MSRKPPSPDQPALPRRVRPAAAGAASDLSATLVLPAQDAPQRPDFSATVELPPEEVPQPPATPFAPGFRPDPEPTVKLHIGSIMQAAAPAPSQAPAWRSRRRRRPTPETTANMDADDISSSPATPFKPSRHSEPALRDRPSTAGVPWTEGAERKVSAPSPGQQRTVSLSIRALTAPSEPAALAPPPVAVVGVEAAEVEVAEIPVPAPTPVEVPAPAPELPARRVYIAEPTDDGWANPVPAAPTPAKKEARPMRTARPNLRNALYKKLKR